MADLSLDIEITRAQNRNYALAEGFHRMARQGNSWSLFLRCQALAERHYRRAVEEFERLKALRADLPNEAILEVQSEENKPTSAPPAEPISTLVQGSRSGGGPLLSPNPRAQKVFAPTHFSGYRQERGGAARCGDHRKRRFWPAGGGQDRADQFRGRTLGTCGLPHRSGRREPEVPVAMPAFRISKVRPRPFVTPVNERALPKHILIER